MMRKIIAAGAAVTLMKPATIIATAVAGAYALTIAILALFPGINKETFYAPNGTSPFKDFSTNVSINVIQLQSIFN